MQQLHSAIYEELQRVARRQETTTYSAIAPLASLDMERPVDREEMRSILSAISTYEHHQGRPLLSAIVVHKQDNIPGEGFFELARTLGLFRGNDRVAFFCREVAKVHDAWKVGPAS